MKGVKSLFFNENCILRFVACVCCRKCILSPRISLIILQNLYFMISKYFNSNFGKYLGKLLVKYVTSNHTFLEPDLEQ